MGSYCSRKSGKSPAGAVALDDALVAVALADAGHVHKVAGGEGEGVVVEVLVVEVADVPVHGFAVLLEVVLVQRHVRLERAADHGV